MSWVGTGEPSPVITISPGCAGTSNVSGLTDAAITCG